MRIYHDSQQVAEWSLPGLPPVIVSALFSPPPMVAERQRIEINAYCTATDPEGYPVAGFVLPGRWEPGSEPGGANVGRILVEMPEQPDAQAPPSLSIRLMAFNEFEAA